MSSQKARNERERIAQESNNDQRAPDGGQSQTPPRNDPHTPRPVTKHNAGSPPREPAQETKSAHPSHEPIASSGSAPDDSAEAGRKTQQHAKPTTTGAATKRAGEMAEHRRTICKTWAPPAERQRKMQSGRYRLAVVRSSAPSRKRHDRAAAQRRHEATRKPAAATKPGKTRMLKLRAAPRHGRTHSDTPKAGPSRRPSPGRQP